MDLTFLHPFPADAPHSALVRLARLGDALARAGAEVEVWAGPGTPPASSFRWREVFSDPPSRARHRRELAEALSRHRPEGWLSARGAAGAGLLAGLTRSPTGRDIPYLLELHRPPLGRGSEKDLRRPWPRLRLRRAVRRAVSGAAGLVFVSEPLRDALVRNRRWRRPPSLVLPSGCPAPVAVPPSDETRGLDLLYTGKLERRKGLDDLLAALARLPDRHLTVAGGSPEEVERYRRRARELGIGERVRFLGRRPPSEIPSLAARARVGVCPLPVRRGPVSARYTSSLKLLEMLAAGLPVVATTAPPVTALVADEREALLARPDDPASLAAALTRLSEDRALALSLATRGLALAEHHTWDRRAADLLEFLEDPPGRDAAGVW